MEQEKHTIVKVEAEIDLTKPHLWEVFRRVEQAEGNPRATLGFWWGTLAEVAEKLAPVALDDGLGFKYISDEKPAPSLVKGFPVSVLGASPESVTVAFRSIAREGEVRMKAASTWISDHGMEGTEQAFVMVPVHLEYPKR